MYPALIQCFRVEPAESTREAEFIQRNIDATRVAMGLHDVDVKPFAYDEQLGADALVRNAETVRNIRLWDPQDLAVVGPLPHLVPLLAATQRMVPHIVVATDRIGAELVAVLPAEPDLHAEVSGRDLHVTRSAPGG